MTFWRRPFQTSATELTDAVFTGASLMGDGSISLAGTVTKTREVWRDRAWLRKLKRFPAWVHEWRLRFARRRASLAVQRLRDLSGKPVAFVIAHGAGAIVSHGSFSLTHEREVDGQTNVEFTGRVLGPDEDVHYSFL